MKLIVNKTYYFTNSYGNEYIPENIINENLQNKDYDKLQGNTFQLFTLTEPHNYKIKHEYIIFPSNEISSDLCKFI